MKKADDNLEKIFRLFVFDYNELKKKNEIYNYICNNRESLWKEWWIEIFPVIEQSLYVDIVINLYKFIDETNKVVKFKSLCDNHSLNEYTKFTNDFEKIKKIRHSIIAHSSYDLHINIDSDDILYKWNNIVRAMEVAKKSLENSTDKIDSEEYNLSIKEIDKYLSMVFEILSKINKYLKFNIWFNWLD